MWQQGPVWGGLERSPPPKTHYIKMGLKQVLPILALAATCHGAALPEAEHFDMDTVMDLVQEFIANPDPYMEAFGVRAKRHVEDLNRSGFKQFPIPFIGAEVGIKYKDPSNRDKGGEAYVEILDLASLVPRARSRKVQLHAKFDGGASNSDGLFTMEVDYHFQHKDGSGTEEGSMKVVREKRGGMWHTDIKTEAHPFSGPRPPAWQEHQGRHHQGRSHLHHRGNPQQVRPGHEAEVDAEDELDHPVVELVVLEEHLYEEDPSKEEETKLTRQNHYRVVEQLHYLILSSHSRD